MAKLEEHYLINIMVITIIFDSQNRCFVKSAYQRQSDRKISGIETSHAVQSQSEQCVHTIIWVTVVLVQGCSDIGLGI